MHILALSPVLAELNPLIAPQEGLGIWLTVVFILVAGLLKWKVWGPLSSAIDEREKSIKAAVEQARTEREAAEKVLAEQQKAAAEARREAGEMVRRSQAEVEKAKEALFAQARAEADSLVKQARQQIEDEKKKALAEIKDVAVELAMGAASKLISQQLDQPAHKALAEEYIKSVQNAPRA
jgi:F-type H+-transporting ATPase subunit b